MTTNQSNWESRLREVKDPSDIYFVRQLGQLEIMALESFIRTLLKEQRDELYDEIEELIHGDVASDLVVLKILQIIKTKI